MCIRFVYTLLDVVSYYDLSDLSMSVMVLQIKSLDWGGWGEFYPVLLWIFGISLTLQTPLVIRTECCRDEQGEGCGLDGRQGRRDLTLAIDARQTQLLDRRKPHAATQHGSPQVKDPPTGFVSYLFIYLFIDIF